MKLDRSKIRLLLYRIVLFVYSTTIAIAVLNRLKYSIFSIFFLVAFAGCDFINTETGNGDIVEDFRSYDDFDELEIAGNYQVTLISNSSNTGINIRADENLQDLIKTELKGSTLEVYSEVRLRGSETIQLTVNYDNLHKIEISGAAQLDNEGKLKSEILEVQMSGAGAMELDIEATKLHLDMSGAGAVILSGSTEIQKVTLSGAGSFEAYDLVSKKAYVTISGVGGAQLSVDEVLDATVSGVGGITYRGNPKVNKSVSGLGKVVGQDNSDL